MKKLLTIAAASLALLGNVNADIQAPPSSEYTATRKLGRAISNILYGVVEIPEQIVRKSEDHGRKAGWSYGAVDGTHRALKRMGYGVYELVTFYAPTYKCSYKPPYSGACGSNGRIEHNVSGGLSEFPPELGAETYYGYTRTQKY